MINFSRDGWSVLLCCYRSTTTTTTITKGTPSSVARHPIAGSEADCVKDFCCVPGVFQPGNPPATQAQVRRGLKNVQDQGKRDTEPELAERGTAPTVPAYVTAYATSIISSACGCLNIPTPTTTVKTSSTTTSTNTIAVTATVCSLNRSTFPQIC